MEVIQLRYFLICGHMRIHSFYCGRMWPTWRNINHGNTDLGVNIQLRISVLASTFIETHNKQESVTWSARLLKNKT